MKGLVLRQHCIGGYRKPINGHLRVALVRLAANHLSTPYTRQYNIDGVLASAIRK